MAFFGAPSRGKSSATHNHQEQEDVDDFPSSQMTSNKMFNNKGIFQKCLSDDEDMFESSQMSTNGNCESTVGFNFALSQELMSGSQCNEYDQLQTSQSQRYMGGNNSCQMLSFSQLAGRGNEREYSSDEILGSNTSCSQPLNINSQNPNKGKGNNQSDSSEVTFTQILEDINRKRAMFSPRHDSSNNPFLFSSDSSSVASKTISQSMFNPANSTISDPKIVLKPNPLKPVKNILKVHSASSTNNAFPGRAGLFSGIPSPFKRAGQPGNPFQKISNQENNDSNDTYDDDKPILSSQPVISSSVPRKPVFGKSLKVSQSFKPVFKKPMQAAELKELENSKFRKTVQKASTMVKQVEKSLNNPIDNHRHIKNIYENSGKKVTTNSESGNTDQNSKYVTSNVFKKYKPKMIPALETVIENTPVTGNKTTNGSATSNVTKGVQIRNNNNTLTMKSVQKNVLSLKKTDSVPRPKILLKSEEELCGMKTEMFSVNEAQPALETFAMEKKESPCQPCTVSPAPSHLNHFKEKYAHLYKGGPIAAIRAKNSPANHDQDHEQDNKSTVAKKHHFKSMVSKMPTLNVSNDADQGNSGLGAKKLSSEKNKSRKMPLCNATTPAEAPRATSEDPSALDNRSDLICSSVMATAGSSFPEKDLFPTPEKVRFYFNSGTFILLCIENFKNESDLQLYHAAVCSSCCNDS